LKEPVAGSNILTESCLIAERVVVKPESKYHSGVWSLNERSYPASRSYYNELWWDARKALATRVVPRL